MDLLVDTNPHEEEIFKLLCATHPHAKRERLDVGDIMIRSPDRTIVIERKTWDDLRSSIADGRKSEQQMRALGGDNVHFMYIIVSSKIPKWNHKPSRGIPNANAFCSLLKTQLRDKVTVHWAQDTEDIIEVVSYIYKQLRDNKLMMSTHARHVDAYVQQRKRKCANDNPFVQMLASVDGSSVQKAEAISTHFPTMEKLVKASEDEIANIKVGKQRIGPKLANNYTQILHGPSIPASTPTSTSISTPTSPTAL